MAVGAQDYEVPFRGYEVPWQLPDVPPCEASGREPGPSPSRGRPTAPAQGLQPLARVVGILADADVAAIVKLYDGELMVEATGRPTGRLWRGCVVPVHPCLGGARNVTARLLLDGTLRWCHAAPPRGFSSAALLAAPSIAGECRLMLVANQRRELVPARLNAAAEFLFQLRPVRPALSVVEP